MRALTTACCALVLGSAVIALAQVPAGDEFLVNTYTTGSQYLPHAVLDSRGDFVVLWATGDVVAQRFGSAGDRRGTEFVVNTYTTGGQGFRVGDRPLAALPDGRFVVAWTSTHLSGDQYNIYGQRFASSGARTGGEFQVNSYTSDGQFMPAVAAADTGRFVVTWVSFGQDGDHWGVFGQRFDEAGSREGTEFRVNSFTTSGQYSPKVAADAAGNFVVVWTSYGQDGSGDGVFGQSFDAAGQQRGAEFRVNTYTTGAQPVYGVATVPGGFVVTWVSTQPSGPIAVFARRFDTVGIPIGSEFRVNTHTSQAFLSSVAADRAGNFVVAWTAVAPIQPVDLDVRAQRFTAGGAPRGGEFRVNTYTTDNQYFPSISSDPVGNLVVVWQSYEQDGSSHGVFAQRFGGLFPAALAVDAARQPRARAGRDGRRASLVAQRERRGADVLVQPGSRPSPGPPARTYTITDGAADYGTVPERRHRALHRLLSAWRSPTRHRGRRCTGTRVLEETITPDAQGQQKLWIAARRRQLHRRAGARAPSTASSRRCCTAASPAAAAADTYCPAASTTREQMAVFVLVAKEGAGYAPPACATPVFGDVPATSPFCRWIEELARRGVVSGCGGGNYCPTAPVTREQMAVFVLRTLDPGAQPAGLHDADVRRRAGVAARSAAGSRSWRGAAW